MNFLPSQVALIAPPLVGTMESAEREFAACVVVRVCQVNGDAWKPVSIVEVVKVVKDDVEAKREPLCSLTRNPFFRPNFQKLADGKYARWTGEPNESDIELTEQGIASLERWVRDVNASIDPPPGDTPR